MKRNLPFVLVMLVSAGLMFASGRRDQAAPEQIEEPKGVTEAETVKVFVSILPQQFFAKQIGGDRVEVTVMVLPGSSPGNYEPTPRQVQALGEADLFFTIGVPFERAFMPTVEKNIPALRIIPTDAGIEKRSLQQGDDAHPDPHVWLDPILVKQQAAVMRDALIEIDPDHTEEYYSRYTAFAEQLDELDKELQEALAPVYGGTLFVYHPAFGYFLDRYNIEQVAIETGGKEPSPGQLQKVIERALQEDVRVIFIQPEFPQSSAKAVAEAINGSVVTVVPLSPDYINNLRSIAMQVREGLKD